MEITRFRGDTKADQFSLTQDGVAVDITGFSFILTVNTITAPDVATPGVVVFALTGTITNPTGGKVEFAPTPLEADQVPATYFYDIQMTDSGGAISTIAKDKYKFVQDITK